MFTAATCGEFWAGGASDPGGWTTSSFYVPSWHPGQHSRGSPAHPRRQDEAAVPLSAGHTSAYRYHGDRVWQDVWVQGVTEEHSRLWGGVWYRDTEPEEAAQEETDCMWCTRYSVWRGEPHCGEDRLRHTEDTECLQGALGETPICRAGLLCPQDRAAQTEREQTHWADGRWRGRLAGKELLFSKVT